MKKLAFILTITAIFLMTTSSIFAASKTTYLSLYINGERIITQTKPFIDNGRVMVPLKISLQKLKFTFQYDKKSKTYTAEGNAGTLVDPMKTSNIKVTEGEKIGYINGNKITLSVAPYTKNGTLYVPSTFLTKAINRFVEYNKEHLAVIIGLDPKLADYNQMTLGMSLQDVKTEETRKLVSSGTDLFDNKYIEYEIKMLYLKNKGTIRYTFENNKLIEIYVTNTGIEDFSDLYSYFIATQMDFDDLYNKGDFTDAFKWDADKYTINAYESLYKNDLEEMVYMAMRSSELSLVAKYEAVTHDVGLIMMNHGSFSKPSFGVGLLYSVHTND